MTKSEIRNQIQQIFDTYPSTHETYEYFELYVGNMHHAKVTKTNLEDLLYNIKFFKNNLVVSK